MKKYISVFKISFQQEFAYRLNFVMWRVRNVLQIFLIFFLWDAVFKEQGTVVFDYNREKILTYVFGILVIKAIVLSARSVDIAGELSRGDLSNYLIKPVNFLKYWFTRDVASKTLNMSFVVIEFILLFYILKPPIYFQADFVLLLMFFISLAIAVILYFLILFLFNLFPLWYPDQAWGPTFLLMIFADFLGGGVFPLDIIPAGIQKILYLTPFPYLLFNPLQIYLGKIEVGIAMKSILIASLWAIVLYITVKRVWSIGLKAYSHEGK
jgi:ABC-2 type transport system permease protein